MHSLYSLIREYRELQKKMYFETISGEYGACSMIFTWSNDSIQYISERWRIIIIQYRRQVGLLSWWFCVVQHRLNTSKGVHNAVCWLSAPVKRITSRLSGLNASQPCLVNKKGRTQYKRVFYSPLNLKRLTENIPNIFIVKSSKGFSKFYDINVTLSLHYFTK